MNEICDEDLLSTAEQSTKRSCQVQRFNIQPTLKQLYLEDELRREINFSEIAGKSAALRQVLWKVETVGPTDSTVLILGETGTGKELIARAIHQQSRRKDKPLIRVNCACIPKELYESEFFGHVRGAFTSAIRDRIGRIEAASSGTLFLDEIGEIPLELQSKLLRVLEEKCYERLHPQKLRGAINAFDLPAGLLQNSKEVVPLAASHFRFGQVFRLGPVATVYLKRSQIDRGTIRREIELQSATAREDDRAFDDVSQLPDVAGPVVTLERFNARSGQSRFRTPQLLH